MDPLHALSSDLQIQHAAAVGASSFITPPRLDSKIQHACNIADITDAPLHVIGFKLSKQPQCRSKLQYTFVNDLRVPASKDFNYDATSGISAERINLFSGQYLHFHGQYPFSLSIIHPNTLTRLIYCNDLRDGETMVVRNPKPPADLRI
ncbi:hypothetical protein C8R43DRAFT_1141859 [Mycena crocata]|nr:hypothetical protein C8R43DRAFT_1141859 [Mycena crocata]